MKDRIESLRSELSIFNEEAIKKASDNSGMSLEQCQDADAEREANYHVLENDWLKFHNLYLNGVWDCFEFLKSRITAIPTPETFTEAQVREGIKQWAEKNVMGYASTAGVIADEIINKIKPQ